MSPFIVILLATSFALAITTTMLGGDNSAFVAAKLLRDAAENRRKSPRPHYGIPFVFEKAREEVLALEVKP